MVNNENDRSASFGNSGDKDNNTFREHKDKMKLFRASHNNGTDTDKDIFKMMVPYTIGQSLVETGGTASFGDERYWLTLVPVNEVTGQRFLYN